MIKEDLNFLQVTTERWYEAPHNRKAWYEIYSRGVIECQLKQDKTWIKQQDSRDIENSSFGRKFRRRADTVRCKCSSEKMLPMS